MRYHKLFYELGVIQQCLLSRSLENQETNPLNKPLRVRCGGPAVKRCPGVFVWLALRLGPDCIITVRYQQQDMASEHVNLRLSIFERDLTLTKL